MPREKVLTFPHCKRELYDITLLKDDEKEALTTGTITDEEGKPVRYARVHFTANDDSEKEVSTDQHGRFEVKLPPGDYHISATNMYYHSAAVQKFTVPVGGATVRDLTMRNQKWNEDKMVIEQ